MPSGADAEWGNLKADADVRGSMADEAEEAQQAKKKKKSRRRAKEAEAEKASAMTPVASTVAAHCFTPCRLLAAWRAAAQHSAAASVASRRLSRPKPQHDSGATQC